MRKDQFRFVNTYSTLVEYNRILRIHSDHTSHGIVPDETAWLKTHSATASGSAE